MEAKYQKLFCMVKKRSGFTLIEMLIVIIILGILAMVIVPQITVSTEDAKVSTAKQNLATLRSAIGLYYAQHNNTYPDGTNVVNQLTLYSNLAGGTSGTLTGGYTLGPYMKGGLPTNPFNDLSNVATAATADLTAARTTTGVSAWMYWNAVGLVFLNDGGTSGTITHNSY